MAAGGKGKRGEETGGSLKGKGRRGGEEEREREGEGPNKVSREIDAPGFINDAVTLR